MSMVTDGESERTPVLVTLPSGVVANLSRAEAAQLREDIGQWQRENRKVRRRAGLRVQAARAQPSVPAEERSWPPDPVWGTDARGRFRYTDYDGESLEVWRDNDGELWVDKKGEGPVYVRPEDIHLIQEAIKKPEPPSRPRQEQPEWRGDREYLQAQHERSWTPERYGGTKG